MNIATTKKIAYAITLIFWVVYIIAVFSSSGKMDVGWKVALLILGLAISAFSFILRKKKNESRKNLKELRDELLQKKWEEEHSGM